MKQIKKKEFTKYDPLIKWHHPDGVLSKLLRLIPQIGYQKFLSGAGYNKERDVFVSVLFTYAVRKWSQREWLIQQVDDPPDFYIISPTNRAMSEKSMDRVGIEIVEIKSENPEETVETIKRTKLQNYAPARGTALLVFLHSKNAIRIGFQFSAWAMKNIESFNNFSELCCLYLESFSPVTTWTYWLVNVFKRWSQKCILSEEFNKGILFPHPLIEKYQYKIVE